MEHGLYLKIEKITNKLINEKGCVERNYHIIEEDEKRAIRMANITEDYLNLENENEKEQYKREKFGDYDINKDAIDSVLAVYCEEIKIMLREGYSQREIRKFFVGNRKRYATFSIEYGKEKGNFEYYNKEESKKYKDFLIRCFAILPRDDLKRFTNGKIKDTGVLMDTLLSDKPCSEIEREKQRLTIFRFFTISDIAGLGNTYSFGTGESIFFALNESIKTMYEVKK